MFSYSSTAACAAEMMPWSRVSYENYQIVIKFRLFRTMSGHSTSAPTLLYIRKFPFCFSLNSELKMFRYFLCRIFALKFSLWNIQKLIRKLEYSALPLLRKTTCLPAISTWRGQRNTTTSSSLLPNHRYGKGQFMRCLIGVGGFAIYSAANDIQHSYLGLSFRRA